MLLKHLFGCPQLNEQKFILVVRAVEVIVFLVSFLCPGCCGNTALHNCAVEFVPLSILKIIMNLDKLLHGESPLSIILQLK